LRRECGRARRTIAAFARQFLIIDIRLGQAMEISMRLSLKLLAVFALGAGALGFSAASAHGNDGRGHDKRDSHYSHDQRDSRYSYGYGERYREGRPYSREIYDTRYRAHIVVVESISPSRRGPDFTCTVSARGPEAHRVPYRHLKRIAKRECSRRAHVIIRA